MVKFFCMQDTGKYGASEQLMKDTLRGVDLAYLSEAEHSEVMRSVLKTLDFLGFF